MLVEVTQLNVRGRPLFKTELGPKYRGEFDMVENRIHKFGRVVSCATLKCCTDGLGTHLMPELMDARIIWVSDRTMRVIGNEFIDGAQYGQSWDMKVL